MKIPVICGVIDRRILVNYRVDATVLAQRLPPPFRPNLVRGMGLVGICLIRLKRVRPASWPSWLGVRSENAAHRVAVEWDAEGGVRDGVYVHRRDTSSWMNSLVGGRLFPGILHHARFQVQESHDHFSVAMRSHDGATSMSVRARRVAQLPGTSIFRSLDEISDFFETGSLGYSATSNPARFQGLELRCATWKIEPLDVDEVRSSYFEDPQLFPPGSIEFDSALLMRGIAHEWHGKTDMCCAATPTPLRQRWTAATESTPSVPAVGTTE